MRVNCKRQVYKIKMLKIKMEKRGKLRNKRKRIFGIIITAVFFLAFVNVVSALYIDTGEPFQNVTDCGELNTPNAVYTLMNNVNTDDIFSDCFDINANNITLDGNGFSVYTEGSYGYGMSLEGLSYITIKNFNNITGFYIGISLNIVSYSNISNINLDLNYQGINIEHSSNNNFFNISSYSNQDQGILLTDSFNNYFNGSLYSNSNADISCYSSDNNINNGLSYSFQEGCDTWIFLFGPGLINHCGYISQPGLYTLNQSLSTNNTCFTISSNNVTLDGNGFSIEGNNSYGNGIYADSIRNLTIKNFKNITRFYSGIYLVSVTNSALYNISSDLNYQGIDIEYSSNNTFFNISSYSNTNQGIFLNDSFNNYFNGSSYSNSNVDIFCSSPDININNGLSYSFQEGCDTWIFPFGPGLINHCGYISQPGLYILNQSLSTNNTCFIISSNDVTLDCQNWGNKIIYGDLPSESSYYGIYSNASNIYVKNCEITAGEASSPGHTDYAIYSENNQYGNFYNLNISLSDQGMHFYNSSYNNLSSIISKVDGSYGIFISSSSNNILRNIVLSFQSSGIYVTSSSNNLFSNITLSNNGNGVLFLFSSNNTLLNSSATSCFTNGVSLTSSNNNTLSDLYLKYNNCGLSLASSSNITLSNISSLLNSNGLSLSGPKPYSSNLKFSDNLVSPIINSMALSEYSERVYTKNSNVSFNFSIKYTNGTSTNRFIYNISIYPNTPFYSLNDSDNLFFTFNATRDGVYNIRVNVTLLDTNDSEVRNYVFLVGDTSSRTIRYYMHHHPLYHAQGSIFGATDSGSMLPYQTTDNEEIHCGIFVLSEPDEVVNQLFIIKNISAGSFYRAGNPFFLIESYKTYSGDGNYSQELPYSNGYVFNTANFTDLNITSDYAWRFYWLSLKLDGGSPSLVSNATHQSYADFTYLYSGPQILQFQENPGSDIRNIQLLSSTFNTADKKNSSLEFDGTGNFTIALNMSNSTFNNYTVLYDGIPCSSNSNCTLNYNSGGIVNVSLSLD